MNFLKLKYYVFNLICVLVISFSFIGAFFVDNNINQVSAESVSFVFPDTWYDSSIENNHSDYDQALENLKSNPSLSGIDHLVFCIQGISQNKVSFILMKPLHYEEYLQGSTTYTTAFGDYFYSRNTLSIESLSTYQFEFEHPVFPPTSAVQDSNITYNHTSTKYTITNTYYDGTKYSWYIVRYPMALYSFSTSFVYDPILSPLLDYPYNLDIQTQGFSEWLINTGRYREINSAMISAHVNRYVELFAEYGGSLSFFKKWVSQYFNFLNIGQGITDYNVILNKTRQLYQEYLRLKNDTVGNHLLPRVSSTIEPDTNDTNQTLITNTVNDTEIEKILRDILRTLLSFPSTWYDMHQQLMNKLDELDLTTNIVNDGGTNDLDVLFNYDQEEFDSDWNSFEELINNDVNSKTALIDSINNRSVMPENMLSDQETFSLTVPLIDGYTVSQDGASYSTNINNYTFDMSEYPIFDSVFKKIKRFIGVIMIIAYLVSLRYRIPRIVRGES